AGVGRFPHPAARRHVATDRLLACTNVDDTRVRRYDSNRADRAAEVAVGDRLPGLTSVSRLPDAASGRAEVVDIGLIGNAFDCVGTSAAIGTDLSPLQIFQDRDVGCGR